ncbi:hypothetical protein PEDI_42960 [Persicobacter diffluens]|uniref:Uncharacterized protein n=1 Tax=Persicobacter diffluens TaxID=981 RepID=A0AAN5ALW9_9BACT|nr:hypothetical protein PEDI_42960 [Persicobacter diffluens]
MKISILLFLLLVSSGLFAQNRTEAILWAPNHNNLKILHLPYGKAQIIRSDRAMLQKNRWGNPPSQKSLFRKGKQSKIRVGSDKMRRKNPLLQSALKKS